MIEVNKIHIIYAYLAQYKGGMFGGLFYLCNEFGGNRTESLCYPRKRGTPLATSVPGEVFEIEGAEDGSTISPGTAKSVHRLTASSSELIAWSAKDRANKALKAAGDDAKARKRMDPFKSALDPIREAYKSASSAQRAQLLAQVVRYVTGS